MALHQPTSITMTGADERTPIPGLLDLLIHPNVEIGLLYTVSPEGRNRYPGRDWLQLASKLLEGRFAVHVCGKRARDQLVTGELDWLVSYATRIQVNGKVRSGDLGVGFLELVCKRYPTHTIITQHCAGNEPLLAAAADNHALLVDGSGGEGISPSNWARPEVAKQVGFAGGIGADNLVPTLEALDGLGNPTPWWVDFETKLRTQDWFDLEKANRALALFEVWNRRRLDSRQEVGSAANYPNRALVR